MGAAGGGPPSPSPQSESVSEFLLSNGAAAAAAGDVCVEVGIDGWRLDFGGFFGYLFANFLKYGSRDLSSFTVGILDKDGIPDPLVGLILNTGLGGSDRPHPL